MPIKFLNCMKPQKNKILLFLFVGGFLSCVTNNDTRGASGKKQKKDHVFQVRCTPEGKVKTYSRGDLVCIKDKLMISDKEKLEIHFVVTNKEAKDPYKHGYQELRRYKNNKIIETLKLRRDDDPYWSLTPFVRIREEKYLADINGDGFLEFAILPFHPGSAVIMTARIYSLKDKIEFWGSGRYQFEGDTFVKLNCPECSKFNFEACKSCE